MEADWLVLELFLINFSLSRPICVSLEFLKKFWRIHDSNGFSTNRWHSSRGIQDVMNLDLVHRNVIVRSIWKLLIKVGEQFKSCFWIFNVLSPLSCSFLWLDHLHSVFHKWSYFLLETLLLISPYSCRLEILCKLNQSIVPSHYFFLRCSIVSLIALKVLLPLGVVIRFLKNAIVACSHCVV